uniref:Uncharacterized protein n=1 Tax=Sphenodon punctatus TaxID=8508 RepID=A0A8D0GW88_SPHPU
MDENNGLLLVELNPPNPWDTEPRTSENLAFGEVQSPTTHGQWYQMQLRDLIGSTGSNDPGPTHGRGHRPRPQLHLPLFLSSYPTLKKLAEKRPDVPIYVGKTERPVFWFLDQSGVKLTNINIVPFGVWQQVDKNLRFMILMDGVHPEMDTCIIVEYKGHKILNTVDCTRPNGGTLPEKVDIMMSDFAGGASGFPMTFSGGKFTEEWKAQFIKTERKKLLNYKAQLVANLKPKIYCPFAGYFVEAHPSDKYIKETNLKNDPDELNRQIRKKSSDISTWTPKPGAILDLARMLKDPTDSLGISDPPAGTKIFKESWDFDLYLNVLSVAIEDEVFRYPSWVKEYYTWAGFKGYNLVIRSFGLGNIPHRESTNTMVIRRKGYKGCISKSSPYTPRPQPRLSIMRHVVKHGLLWDDLYIGFQNRLQRDPDIYHHQ